MYSGSREWLHLGEDESVVFESRPHPVAMGWGLPAGLLLILGGLVLVGWATAEGWTVAVTILGLLAALIGFAVVGVRYLLWTNTRYVITTAELYEKRGVFSRDVTQFRLDRVQNTSLRQSAIGRLLGYGELTVYTAGSGDPELTFEWVAQPSRASAVLSEQLGGDRAPADAR